MVGRYVETTGVSTTKACNNCIAAVPFLGKCPLKFSGVCKKGKA